jgi:hypothetical protein
MNFDLNIENYKISELEEMFELPKNYDESIIEFQKNIILNSTLKTNMNKEKKQGIIMFIEKVSDLLKSQTLKLTQNNIVPNSNNFSQKNIIEKQSTPYDHSSPSEFYQGVLNPLSKRILRQNINIDTRFRDNYYNTTSSNFHVDLPIKLTDVVSLQLTALELPSTFYTISQAFNNNFFVIEIPNEDKLVITIPDGNYDYVSMQFFINDFLSRTTYGSYSQISVISDANTPNGGGPFGGSGKMIFGLKQDSTINTFSLNFSTDKYGDIDNQMPLQLKLGWMLGFRAGYYENNKTYVSEGIINLSGPKYLYLVVDDFNNNVCDGFFGAFTTSILNKNILARISLQGNMFNFSIKDNLNLITTPRQYFGPVNIQKLQIQLLDEFGRVINLNNMDYSFCLTFQTIYDL